MHNHKDLVIWKKSIDLAKEVYILTRALPPSEKFGLVSQMRRSAVSVASNIAEGAGRNSDLEFLHFLKISLGSLYELETQMLISVQVDLVAEKEGLQIQKNLVQLQKQIHKLISHFEIKNQKHSRNPGRN